MGDQPPPVDEPAGIDREPAVRQLDFDSAHGELINKGDHEDEAEADQHALNQAGLTLRNVDAPVEVIALCAQNSAFSPPHRNVQPATGWCRERESNPHEVALIGF